PSLSFSCSAVTLLLSELETYRYTAWSGFELLGAPLTEMHVGPLPVCVLGATLERTGTPFEPMLKPSIAFAAFAAMYRYLPFRSNDMPIGPESVVVVPIKVGMPFEVE